MTASAPPRGPGLAVGQEVEVEVGPVAHGGHCVARYDGQVLFVRHALPGELVLARVTESGSGGRFVRADAVEIRSPSPHRRVAPCPYAGPQGCGGCDWQHTDVAYGRVLKAQVVREQFARLAHLDLPVVVEAVPGDEDGLRWRTRVELAVDPDGRAGLRRHRSREVIPIDECLIAGRGLAGSGALARQWSGFEAVDVVMPGGGVDPVVVPVRQGAGVPRAGARHAAPSARVPHVRERVEGERWTGELSVSARGFWQVHPGAAATYVDHILGELAPRPGERVVDLYAGAGLFALALADAVGGSGQVEAVESDRQGTDDGIRNVQGHPQVRFTRGRADRVLSVMSRRRLRADLVVLDPPRAGAGRAVIEALAGLRPRAVAYVACDPAALARDTAFAMDLGLRLRSLRAFDAFPMTHHVECIAIFEPTPGDRRPVV